MNVYLNLLLDFQTLPREAKARTFMEVSGQAHYENVASNILAFYFDPKEEHGLKNLLVMAFLNMAGHKGGEVSEATSIEREYAAEDGKRIDLMIAGVDFVIGIENKIYHPEANDFGNYGRVIDSLGAEKSITVKAVLGLHVHAWRPALPGGFLRFSYTQLWNHVRGNLGHYLPTANPKWVTYLIDFMETTSRLAGESQPNREFTDFFLKHNDVIEQLVSERQALINRLDGYNYALEANLRCELEKHACITKIQVWQRIVFAVDFLIQGHTLVLDLARWDVVWRLTVFERTPQSPEFIRSLASTASIRECSPEIQPDDGRFLLHSWDLHVTQVDLQNAVLNAVNAIIAAGAELSTQPCSEPVLRD